MTKFILIVILLLSVSVGAFYYLDKSTINRSGRLLLSKGTINFGTQEFAQGLPIPTKFTCNGRDINPTLYIERVPQDAKSLVIIMDDPDATPDTFTHWILFNIDPSEELLEEGEIPAGAVLATNDFGKTQYAGPCPPLGIHRYFYRIYALDTKLTLDEKATRTDVDQAIKGHIITTGETYGEYSKGDF